MAGKRADRAARGPRASLLAALDRSGQRLSFQGMDVWNAWEFTWLNSRGKPEVAVARMEVPAASPRLIESKSMKLYLGSCSEVRFASQQDVIARLEADLSAAAGAPVGLALLAPQEVQGAGLAEFKGQCLDTLDIDIAAYRHQPSLLAPTGGGEASEALYTRLFKSLCPLTGQPDFADVIVEYTGPAISQESLLQYLVSYRRHAEFAEQVTERIFADITQRCRPRALTVTTQYTRRGGIDINPMRTTAAAQPPRARRWRQ